MHVQRVYESPPVQCPTAAATVRTHNRTMRVCCNSIRVYIIMFTLLQQTPRQSHTPLRVDVAAAALINNTNIMRGESATTSGSETGGGGRRREGPRVAPPRRAATQKETREFRFSTSLCSVFSPPSPGRRLH